jgi:hypothetical protein
VQDATLVRSARVTSPATSYHAENALMHAAIDEARDGIYSGDDCG